MDSLIFLPATYYGLRSNPALIGPSVSQLPWRKVTLQKFYDIIIERYVNHVFLLLSNVNTKRHKYLIRFKYCLDKHEKIPTVALRTKRLRSKKLVAQIVPLPTKGLNDTSPRVGKNQRFIHRH